MQTVIDLPEEVLERLNELSVAMQVSREELVRRAVSQYLEPDRHGNLLAAFGLWRDRGEDGLAYQQRIRAEWPD